jgi:hypothetical protein
LGITFQEAEDYRSARKVEQAMGVHWLPGLKTNGKEAFIPQNIPREQLIQTINALSMPATEVPVRTKQALYKMFLATIPRGISEADRTAMLNLYSRNLSSYPVEVVELAVEVVMDKYDFFPSWKQLLDEVSRFSGWRRAYRVALMNVAERRKRTPK